MTRQTLPERRQIETLRFEHDGVHYHASVSRAGDGRVVELFLNAGKPGSALGVMAREAAVAVSLALQHGASAATVLAAMQKLEDQRGGSWQAGPCGRALALALGLESL